MKKIQLTSLIVLTLFLLNGCGGGGGGGVVGENLPIASSLTTVLTYSPSAATNSSVVLDASKSISPTGKPLTYTFNLVSAPTGFRGISYQNSSSIGFFTEYSGTYTFSVTASDGTLTSPPVTAVIKACCENTTTISNASTFISGFPIITTSAIQAAYRKASPNSQEDIFRFGATYQLNPYQLEYLSGATPGTYETQILNNGASLKFAALNGGATITGYSLNIPNTVQVSGDFSQLNYPSDYSSANAKTNSVADPYCGLSDSQITFNAADIGSYALPAINAVPLPASALRIASMKDTWSINNPGFGYGCTKDMQTAVRNTMTRLAALNVNTIALTPWGVIQYHSDGSSSIVAAADLNGSGMNDEDIAWYVRQAHAAGMKVIWTNQIQIALNPDGSNLSNTTSANVTSAYTALNTYLASRGAALQSAGIDAILLGPWYWTNFENYQTSAEFINSNVNLIASLKTSFSGKIYFNLPSPSNINSSLNSVVDAYIFSGGVNYNQSDIANFSVSDIKTKLLNKFNTYSTVVGSVPIIFDPSIQSRQGFFTTNPGYYDPFCTASGSSACQQLSMTGDFSMQATVIEASLEFLAGHLGQYGGVIMNYVRDSNLLPPAKFTNIDATVRGKPAEYIYYRWFNAR